MTKSEIISIIPKDKTKLVELWGKAVLNYEQSKSENNVEKKVEYNKIQRKTMNEILGFALKDYDSNDKQIRLLITKTFAEFWGFLGWWLKDVEIGGEWNEMERHYHKTRLEYKGNI